MPIVEDVPMKLALRRAESLAKQGVESAKKPTSTPLTSDLLERLSSLCLAEFKFTLEQTPAGFYLTDGRKTPGFRINPQPLLTEEACLRFIGRWVLRKLTENNELWKKNR